MKKNYEPILGDRWSDDYFQNRKFNDEKRLKQFQIDGYFLKKFKTEGRLCDVGCSTGEFIKSIGWKGDLFGMEINLHAQKEAEKKGFSFDKNIFTEDDFFDVVVFRGTIQHVDEPFRMIKMAFKSLKKDGVIVFLATPNANSLLYRIKLDLPFLTRKTNFYVPGVKELCNALENYGFEILEVEKPYWRTPYRDFPKDILLFFLNIFSRKFFKHAFWGNSVSIAAKK